MKTFVTAVVTAILLTGCGEKVSMDIVDQNQIISRDNAALNARAYVRAANLPEGVTASAESDSTINSSCRFGDGWATVKLVKDGVAFGKLKCQTTGSGRGLMGCLPEAEFAKKDYASQDGKCDSNITSMRKLDK